MMLPQEIIRAKRDGETLSAGEIGAQDARGADLGRRLEARSRKPHVDALVELDVRASRCFVQRGDQRRIIGFGQRHEPIRAAMADQRVGSGKVDVIDDRDQRGRPTSR
jgi:hypothetical protein